MIAPVPTSVKLGACLSGAGYTARPARTKAAAVAIGEEPDKNGQKEREHE
jgi:hypothetical protein